MKIRILRDTVAGGQPVSAGQSVEVNEAEAKFLIAIGKAEEVAAAEKPPKIETADTPMDGIETADVKPVRKKK